MHRFVTTRRPTGAPRQKRRVVLATDINSPVNFLLLKVTLQTKIGIALLEHLGVDRAMHGVAGRAAFAHRFMLKHERPAMRRVTLSARVVFAQQRRAASFDRWPVVRIVTIAATDFSLQHLVMIGKTKLTAFIEVALETGFGRFARVDDGLIGATRFIVQAARAMTGFAAHIHRAFAFGLQPGVRRRLEGLGDVLMTLSAGGRADKRRAGNLRRRHHGARNRRAGNHNHCERCRAQDDPQLFARRFSFRNPGDCLSFISSWFHRFRLGWQFTGQFVGNLLIGKRVRTPGP